MKVAEWETFPEALRAALITRYPALLWRVTLSRHAGNEIAGVRVQVRQASRTVTIEVPKRAIEQAGLHDLLGEIRQEVEQHLTGP